jgi:tRNA pseudouridine55 synthase
LQLDANKRYEAVACLGVKTSTADAEGDVIETRPVPPITQAMLDAVALQFTGPIRQVPPMHSALKKDGRALYDYARAGITIEREARDVEILSLKISLSAVFTSYIAINIDVTCTKGTYIRTLGEDIGEALGCGAHLTALRRTGTGGFDVSQSISLADLGALTEDARDALLLPVDALLPDHTRVTLDAENAGRFLSGVRRRGVWPDTDRVAVYGTDPPSLLGAAHVVADELIPSRLLSPIEISQVLEQRVHHV